MNRRSGPHPVPIVQQLLDLCEGENEIALTKRAGVAPSYISMLRYHSENPCVFHLGCLAEALGYELQLRKKDNGKGNNS